ncbi:MAG: hypothetical protein AAGC60_10030 [Acidobacteriota bacterium]
MDPGAIVVVHVMNPHEKYWGILHQINPAGIAMRGLNLSSFDDWMRSAAYGDEAGLGLATMFFPLHRVERVFLDEPLGGAESLAQTFERRVGRSVEEWLGLFDAQGTGTDVAN